MISYQLLQKCKNLETLNHSIKPQETNLNNNNNVFSQSEETTLLKYLAVFRKLGFKNLVSSLIPLAIVKNINLKNLFIVCCRLNDFENTKLVIEHIKKTECDLGNWYVDGIIQALSKSNNNLVDYLIKDCKPEIDLITKLKKISLTILDSKTKDDLYIQYYINKNRKVGELLRLNKIEASEMFCLAQKANHLDYMLKYIKFANFVDLKFSIKKDDLLKLTDGLKNVINSHKNENSRASQINALFTICIKKIDIDLIKHFNQELNPNFSLEQLQNFLSVAINHNFVEGADFFYHKLIQNFPEFSFSHENKISLILKANIDILKKTGVEKGFYDIIIWAIDKNIIDQNSLNNTWQHRIGIHKNFAQLSLNDKYKLLGNGTLCWKLNSKEYPSEELGSNSFYGFNPERYTLFKQYIQEKILFESDILWDVNSSTVDQYAFKFSILFNSIETLDNYLAKWFMKNTTPLHDASLIILPFDRGWDIEKWQHFLYQYGPSIKTTLANAFFIENILGEVPRSQAIAKLVTRTLYKNYAVNPKLADLCVKYGYSESIFEYGLDILNRKKTKSDIPQVKILGEDIGCAGYFLETRDDIDTLFYGENTGCCQSIGAAGAECAEHGYTSEYSGFIAIFKNINSEIINNRQKLIDELSNAPKIFIIEKIINSSSNEIIDKAQRKILLTLIEDFKYLHQLNKIAIPSLLELIRSEVIDFIEESTKPTLCAQSWVWISKKNNFGIDSFERRDARYDKLCKPFFDKLAKILVNRWGFNIVVLGKDETCKTPRNLYPIYSGFETPKNYPKDCHRDSNSLYLVKQYMPLVEQLRLNLLNWNGDGNNNNFALLETNLINYLMSIKVKKEHSIRSIKVVAPIHILAQLWFDLTEYAQKYLISFMKIETCMQKLIEQLCSREDATSIFKDSFKKFVENNHNIFKNYNENIQKQIKLSVFFHMIHNIYFSTINEERYAEMKTMFKKVETNIDLIFLKDFIPLKFNSILNDLEIRYKNLMVQHTQTGDSVSYVNNEYILFRNSLNLRNEFLEKEFVKNDITSVTSSFFTVPNQESHNESTISSISEIKIGSDPKMIDRKPS